MSTFNGRLEEDSLNFIRIDNFEPINYDGESFFLSHLHTDHFKGIFDPGFVKMLVQSQGKVIFCSQITRTFLLNHHRCSIPENKVVPVTVNKPFIVLPTQNNLEPVLVTLLPAGHCPGSVMFLFEQAELRVLYTGDFRIPSNELMKLNALHDDGGTLKKFTSLYLDTTFCDIKYLSFPSRDQTIEDMTDLIKEWLDSSHLNKVGILYNSYHGLEPVLIKLAYTLKVRIWVVDTHSYDNYICIAELADSISSSYEFGIRIHLCPVKSGENCGVCLSYREHTKTIKPCAQTFTQQQLELGRQKEGSNGLVRVAYSMHCSLEELISTVKYLEPQKIYPCVIPSHLNARQVLQNLYLDVEKLKKDAFENKENVASDDSSSPCESPPRKKFYKKEEPENLEEGIPCYLISSDEEDKPLSQGSSLDSPPF